MKFVLLDKCKSCNSYKGILEDLNMVRCKTLNGFIGLTHIVPSHYFEGILNNGLDSVRCVKGEIK